MNNKLQTGVNSINSHAVTFMPSKMAAHSFFRVLLGIFMAKPTPLKKLPSKSQKAAIDT